MIGLGFCVLGFWVLGFFVWGLWVLGFWVKGFWVTGMWSTMKLRISFIIKVSGLNVEDTAGLLVVRIVGELYEGRFVKGAIVFATPTLTNCL